MILIWDKRRLFLHSPLLGGKGLSRSQSEREQFPACDCLFIVYLMRAFLITRVNTPGIPRQDRSRPFEDEVHQVAPAVPQFSRKRRVLFDNNRTHARRRGTPETRRRHHRPGASRWDALQLDDEGHHRLPHRRHKSRSSKTRSARRPIIHNSQDPRSFKLLRKNSRFSLFNSPTRGSMSIIRVKEKDLVGYLKK